MGKMSKDVEDGKIVAALAYILIGIIWYFVDESMKKNYFVKYHVKQGIVFLIAAIIYNIALGILLSILFVPFMYIHVYWLFSLLYYVPLVWMVLGIINVVNGVEKELPVIGKFAKNFKF
ncbi:MAG: hypothetical protein ABIA37_04645 [Candidatus Woesearchaeota archaeon]